MVRGNISDVRTFPVGYYQPKFEPVEAPGTTHLAVVDRNDMAVSLMSTVNLIFGAKLMDGETGIILNNEMDGRRVVATLPCFKFHLIIIATTDFSTPGVTNAFGLPPSPMNYVRGGKRPLSSAAPTIIERDGRFEMAVCCVRNS